MCQIFFCCIIQGVSFYFNHRNVRSWVSASNLQVSVSAFMTKSRSRLEIWARFRSCILYLWLYYQLVNRELSRNFLFNPSRRQAGHPWNIDYISLHNTHMRHSLSTTKQSSIQFQQYRAAYHFLLARKYLRWSNTKYHRLWWVQHLLTKSFWFFVNIKIIAKKTTTPSMHHLWHLQSLSGKFRYRNQTISWSCPDPSFFFKN